MPLDDAFQAGTRSVLMDMAQRPRPPVPQEPAFSMWGVFKAAPKGVVAGAAQGMGSAADVTGAFGDVLGSLGDAGEGGMFGGLTPEERKQTNQARDKLLKEGPSFSTEGGTILRNVGRSYMPDPVTSHAAEQAVGNLFRLGGKAVAAGSILGPYAGAVAVGAEEGFSTADDLAQQGVDLATRTKVGATTAAFTAASLAIPVAGPGIKSTVGLAVAGGPASFMAQNWATREILKGADYSKLAEQYDPFDPVGLALSTILPLGFGAMALRGARGAKAGAKAGEDLPALAHADADTVDAARVNLLRENVDGTRLTPPDDLAGAAAHDVALQRSFDQMASGERVSVSDVIPEPAAARVAQDMEARMAEVRAEVEALPPAIRTTDIPPVAPRTGFDIQALSDQAEALLKGGRQAGEVLGEMRAAGKTVTPELNNMLIAAQELGDRLPAMLDQFRALESARPRAKPMDLIADALDRTNSGAGVQAPAPKSPTQTRLAGIEAENPKTLDAEIPTAFGEDGKVTESMTAREFLAEVRRQASQEAAEAKLLDVAAQCFLRTGG